LNWSDEHFRIFGLEPADGAPTLEAAEALIHHDDRDRARRVFEAALHSGESHEIEPRIARPDGACARRPQPGHGRAQR